MQETAEELSLEERLPELERRVAELEALEFDKEEFLKELRREIRSGSLRHTVILKALLLYFNVFSRHQIIQFICPQFCTLIYYQWPMVAGFLIAEQFEVECHLRRSKTHSLSGHKVCLECESLRLISKFED